MTYSGPALAALAAQFLAVDGEAPAPGAAAALAGQKPAAHAAESLPAMEMPPIDAGGLARLVGEPVSPPPRGRPGGGAGRAARSCGGGRIAPI